jgi:hypothetical protein
LASSSGHERRAVPLLGGRGTLDLDEDAVHFWEGFLDALLNAVHCSVDLFDPQTGSEADLDVQENVLRSQVQGQD